MGLKTYYLEHKVYPDSRWDRHYKAGETYIATYREYEWNEFRREPKTEYLYITMPSLEFGPWPRFYKAKLLKGVKHKTWYYDEEGNYYAKKFKIIGEVNYKKLYEENPDNDQLFALTIKYNDEFRNHYLNLAKTKPEEIYKLSQTAKELLAELNYKEFNDCLINDKDPNSHVAVATAAVHYKNEHYLDILIDYPDKNVKRAIARSGNKKYLDKLIDYPDQTIKHIIALFNNKKYISKLITNEDKIIRRIVARKIWWDEDYKLTQEERVKYLDILVRDYDNDIQWYVVESAIKYNLPQYIEFYLNNETYANIYYRIIETGNLDYIKRLVHSKIETVAKVAQDKLNELTSK